MKLKSLYIENFGGLHQYELEFSDGLTVIREDNGFGKTTLAEFIRAMFYGFPRKAKTLDKNRRQKYTPWQGGKFGGNLTFELDDKLYRIERTFGATPKGDHFQLIDLSANRKTDRFSEEIGLEIFGLDADSFERSTYMPQLREMVTLTTDSIRAKLGDLVEDTGDVGNFEKAITALKTKRSSYIPYRGNGGIVGEVASRMSLVQAELDRTAAKKEDLRSCRQEIETMEDSARVCQDELDLVRKKITEASEMAALAAIHGQHRNLKSRLMQMAEQLAAMEAEYPMGIPEAEALEVAIGQADNRAVLTAQNVTGPEDLAAEAFLERNRSRFADSIPTEAELDHCRILLEDYRIAHAELQNTVLTQGELEQYRNGKELQDSGALDEKRLEKLAQSQRELDKVRNLLENLEPPAEEPEQIRTKEKSVLPAALFLVLGLAGMVTGIVLLALRYFVPGGVILGVGLVSLIVGIFGAMKTMMARELARQRMAQAAADRQNTFLRKRTALEDQARVLETELFRELGRRDFRLAVEQLRLIRSRHLDLQEKVEKIQERRQILNRKILEMEKSVMDFLCHYCNTERPEQFQEHLSELQRTVEVYYRAEETMNSWRQRKARLEKELAECEYALKSFFDGWGLPATGNLRGRLQKIRDDRRYYEDTTEQKENLLRELEAFEQEHSEVLKNPLSAREVNLEEMKNREISLLEENSDLTRQLLQKRQRAQDLRIQIDRISELQDQLEISRIQKNEGQVTAQLLDDTVEFLQMAKDSLSSNYLGPIQRSFRDYLKVMTCEDEKVLITGDLDVQLERQGEVRELGYFSAGQMDTVMLCMRFALVDALFTEEKPFVILDDPFVNLDDNHTAQALELLRTLSEQRQILYMTCNSSRV